MTIIRFITLLVVVAKETEGQKGLCNDHRKMKYLVPCDYHWEGEEDGFGCSVSFLPFLQSGIPAHVRVLTISGVDSLT